MPGLRLLALGVGDAFSSLYYSSCFALEADGAWLLVDCPHPIRKIMREASSAAGISLDVENLLAVAVTHLHADHCSGLEDLAYYSHFLLHRRPSLAMHPDASARLWEGHLSAGMEWSKSVTDGTLSRRSLADYFDLIPLSDVQPVDVGPFRIECRKTLHTIPTTAFRIHAGGRCVGYSTDTAYDPTLIDWLSAADLIIHETNHGIHTPYEKLLALPAVIRDKIRLIHYPDDFDISASAIEPLRQGLIRTVGCRL